MRTKHVVFGLGFLVLLALTSVASAQEAAMCTNPQDTRNQQDPPTLNVTIPIPNGFGFGITIKISPVEDIMFHQQCDCKSGSCQGPARLVNTISVAGTKFIDLTGTVLSNLNQLEVPIPQTVAFSTVLTPIPGSLAPKEMLKVNEQVKGWDADFSFPRSGGIEIGPFQIGFSIASPISLGSTSTVILSGSCKCEKQMIEIPPACMNNKPPQISAPAFLIPNINQPTFSFIAQVSDTNLDDVGLNAIATVKIVGSGPTKFVSFVVDTAQILDRTSIRVIASDDCGAVTRANIRLLINHPPVITEVTSFLKTPSSLFVSVNVFDQDYEDPISISVSSDVDAGGIEHAGGGQKRKVQMVVRILAKVSPLKLTQQNWKIVLP